MMERALLWQVQCHKHQEGNFRSSKKIMHSWQLSKSRIPCFRPDDTVIASGRPPVSRRFWQVQRCICLDVRATHPDTLQCSRRIKFFFTDTDWERQLAIVRTLGQHRLGRGLNMETREARYGKEVVQFTVRTLYDSVWTLPREI